jgi:hypothetical protein
LRKVAPAIRWIAGESMAWLTLRPRSPPRRALRTAVIALASFLLIRPRLAKPLKHLLRHFPDVDVRLRSALMKATSSDEHFKCLSDLSPRAREIYFQLKAAVAQKWQSE